jgi:UDP-glucose 4-epimerase
MRVMVTGATTPLGAALVESLLATGEADAILATGTGERPIREHADVVYRKADLSRPRNLRDLIWGEARDLGIEVVVHSAQHQRNAERGRKPGSTAVDAARELIVACTNHPSIRRLVYRSFAEVYSLNGGASLLDEKSPLEFAPNAPQWLRDRVEADLAICAHIGSRLQIAVVRCAEIVAPDVGSQLWEYLSSRVCLRPYGFDPIVNVLAIEDAAYALALAARSKAVGVFNIPGRDSLPLSRAIARSHRPAVKVPAPLYGPHRFHFAGVLDGSRAARELDFVPTTAVHWPSSWWRELFTRSERTAP